MMTWYWWITCRFCRFIHAYMQTYTPFSLSIFASHSLFFHQRAKYSARYYYRVLHARISNFDNTACIRCLNRSVIRRVFYLIPFSALPLKSSADITVIHGLNIWCFFQWWHFLLFLASSSSLRCWQSLWCWWFTLNETKHLLPLSSEKTPLLFYCYFRLLFCTHRHTCKMRKKKFNIWKLAPLWKAGDGRNARFFVTICDEAEESKRGEATTKKNN